VAGSITVSSIEADLLIQIDADRADPLQARDIAQTSAEVFVEQITAHMLKQDKRDRVEVTMRDYALPGHLHKPKWKVNALAGAILGAVVGVAIAFLLEWLEADVIRKVEDMEQQIGVAVLGLVPGRDHSRDAEIAVGDIP
jgi:capsular polysaccharide biosynthesis protein